MIISVQIYTYDAYKQMGRTQTTGDSLFRCFLPNNYAAATSDAQALLPIRQSDAEWSCTVSFCSIVLAYLNCPHNEMKLTQKQFQNCFKNSQNCFKNTLSKLFLNGFVSFSFRFVDSFSIACLSCPHN